MNMKNRFVMKFNASKSLFLTVCVLYACALAGCSSKEDSKTTANSNSAQPATKTDTTKTDTTKTDTTMTSTDTTTGIAECDLLLAKMKKCMASSSTSDAQKAGIRDHFEPARAMFSKYGAGTAQDKAFGAMMCQNALTQPNSSYSTSKCDLR